MAKRAKTPDQTEQLAEFVTRAQFEDLSADARHHLKLHILDTLGCAIGALGHEIPQKVRNYIDEFPAQGPCTTIGGGKTSPDRATLMNGALVRYLDFMDNFLAKGETCHPSDNFAAVLPIASRTTLYTPPRTNMLQLSM